MCYFLAQDTNFESAFLYPGVLIVRKKLDIKGSPSTQGVLSHILRF